MKSLKLCVLLLVICCAGKAQFEELDVYYPENTLYKKLQIAKVVDVTSAPHMTKEYDRKGRETGWYYADDTVRTNFSYTYHKDTLVKTHMYVIAGISQAYRNEYYLYNKEGRIVYYADINFPEQDKVAENYFDIISYGKRSFTRVRKFTDPAADNDKKTWLYEKTKDGKIDLKKSINSSGKLVAVDSIFYDANKRKVREVNYTIDGHSGHFKINNLFWVNKYEYKNGKVIMMTFKGTKREVQESKNPQITEMILLDNGLISKIYLGDTTGTVLSSQYEYSFWYLLSK